MDPDYLPSNGILVFPNSNVKLKFTACSLDGKPISENLGERNLQLHTTKNGVGFKEFIEEIRDKTSHHLKPSKVNDVGMIDGGFDMIRQELFVQNSVVSFGLLENRSPCSLQFSTADWLGR